MEGEDPFSSHIPSTQEIHYPIEEDLYGEAEEEDMQQYVEMELEYHEYIEHWFQKNHSNEEPLFSSKIIGIISLVVVGFSCSYTLSSLYVKSKNEYIFVLDSHMDSLEVLLDLKEDLFSLVE